MIKKTIYLGDRIITTKKFPFGEGKKATLISKNADVYGAEFDESFKECHFLKDSNSNLPILLKKKGYFLEKNEFKVTSTYINTNKTKEEYVCYLRNKFFEHKKQIPLNIKNFEDSIKYKQNDIENYLKNIKNYTQMCKKLEKDIEKQKQLITKQINIKSFEKEFDKLTKHKLIKDITIKEDPADKEKYIIVTTDDLTYYDSRDPLTFTLGAYKIFIPFNQETRIKAINYKRQIRKGSYFHPCIEAGGRICFGNNASTEVADYRRQTQFAQLIFLIINFLCEPNYDHPFMQALPFSLAQPVTIKPENIFDYLNYQYWQDHETWDEEKNSIQRREVGFVGL